MPKFDEGMEAMLDAFVFESSELLENLDEILMRTEQDELLEDDIAEIFRIMHTIKGSAAMMGLQNMSALAHSVEDLFYIIREDPTVTYDKPALYELLFAGSDSLKNEIENLADDSVPLTDFTAQIEKIHAFAAVMKQPADTPAADSSADDNANIFPEGEDESVKTFFVRFRSSCMMPALRAMVLLNSLNGAAELLSTIPEDLEDAAAGDIISEKGIYIKVHCDDDEEVLATLKEGLDVEDAQLLDKKNFGANTSAAQSDNKADKQAVFAAQAGENAFLVRFAKGCMMPDLRAMVLLKSLGEYAEIKSTIPQDMDADNAGEIIAADGLKIFAVCQDPEKAEEILKSGLDVDSVTRIEAAQPAAQETRDTQNTQNTKNPPKTAPKAGEKKEQSGGSIISVRLDKLDRLLDLVTEIVITQSGVTSSPDLKNVQGDLERFSKSARELKKLTDELQDVVMSIRMVPVQSAFSKMSRVVRDMNKKLGKNVELIFEGADTEADKSVVDILGDPLMHIVRNAVDHGIESPEERAAAGKTQPPQVILSAGYENGEVVISCKDNGAGMDPQKLLAKAKKSGILTKPESEYTKEECLDLIMAAGFSTNEQVTEYSGRGVGMDVVKKNIEKVGGKLTVDSELGEGSTFTIRIPLSLSIIDVLGTNVEGTNFSIPISSVAEIFRAQEEQILSDPDGSELIMLRDKCLRVIRLSDAFNMKRAGERHKLTDGIMLYCRQDGMEAVIYGEELTSDQQVVVKPFPTFLSAFDLKEKGLSGCSILADGSITLIADIGKIFRRCKVKAQAEE